MGNFLIGYGTLLNKTSLGNTIGDTSALAKSVVPIMVYGYKRLFNLRPDHYEPSQKFFTEPIEAAAMNIEPEVDSKFNGLGFPVTEEELVELDKRERYYQRAIVSFHDFYSGQLIGEGYVYTSRPDERWINRDIKTLMPQWRDIVLARTGAYRISDSFGKTFDETTYLGDGKTLMIDYYRDHIGEMSSL